MMSEVSLYVIFGSENIRFYEGIYEEEPAGDSDPPRPRSCWRRWRLQAGGEDPVRELPLGMETEAAF